MDEATLFKFRKCVDSGKFHIMGTGVVWVTWPLFKFWTPLNIFATLVKFGKWIDCASPTPGVKTFPPKWRGLGHVIVLGMKPRSLNFENASTMASASLGLYGLKIPPKRVWCWSRNRCLNFSLFNISGGMRRWRWEEAGLREACGLAYF